MCEIRPINIAAEKHLTKESVQAVAKFLKKLESVTNVSIEQAENLHIRFCYGNTGKEKSVFVVADDGKREGMFVETYKTLRPLQSYDLQAQPGYLYSTEADYVFYLSGNTLFTLPTKRFRCWADKSTDAFRKDCLFETSNGIEIRHHGFFIPKQRLRQDFAKGDVRVSVFRLQNIHEENIDFVQEL